MLQGDVRELKDCENAVAAATGKWGRLDILVNAAAGNFLAPAEVLSPKGFKTGAAQILSVAVYVCTLVPPNDRAVGTHYCTLASPRYLIARDSYTSGSSSYHSESCPLHQKQLSL